MRFIFKYIILALLFLTIAEAQENKVLAKIGTFEITSDEFVARYELTPQLLKENQKIKEELKLEFLYSLIAEKLLALYGEQMRLDTSAIVKQSLQYFEEMFVRDALYKKVIQEKAQYKTDSLLNFYLSNANNVKMIYIYSDNDTDINKIYSLLKLGVPFDSLYSELNSGRIDTFSVSIGQIKEDVENKLFLLPDGAFSSPIEMDNGWYIFKILKRYNPMITKSKGWESDFKNSKRIAKERSEYSFYKEYIKNFFSNKEVKINAKLLRNISSQVYSVLSQRDDQNQDPYNRSLLAKDIAFIGHKMGKDSLVQPIVEMSNSFITTGDYLNFLKFEHFTVDTLDYLFVFKSLSNKLKNFIEYKMLAHEGYLIGLQNSFEVKKQVKMWKENYFMQLVTSMFIDSASVSDDEIITFYNERKNGSLRNKEVNIVEIFTDSLEIVESALQSLDDNADFIELAKKYSKKFDGNVKNLESGFFNVNSKGQLGQIASKMKVGDVYGPIKIQEDILIFKVIAVREDSLLLKNNFTQIKDELKRELGFLKKQKSFNKFIGNLANKYGVDVFKEELKNILVTSHHSIVYNYLGFGGRVLAVPLLNVNMEWVPEWKSNPDNIQ